MLLPLPVTLSLADPNQLTRLVVVFTGRTAQTPDNHRKFTLPPNVFTPYIPYSSWAALGLRTVIIYTTEHHTRAASQSPSYVPFEVPSAHQSADRLGRGLARLPATADEQVAARDTHCGRNILRAAGTTWGGRRAGIPRLRSKNRTNALMFSVPRAAMPPMSLR
jgi:hypothetical protein